MKLRESYHIYALITVILWAFAYVFSRLAMEVFSPFSLGFLRYIAAAAFLIIIVFVKRIRPPEAKDLPMFILSGGTGFFLYMIFFNMGTGMLSSATSSVIIATVPVITALLARAVFNERLAAYQWIAIGIAFLGILVLTFMGGTITVNKGVLWLLFAALSLSAYNLLQRKMTKKYTPLTVSSYSIFIGTVMLFIFAPKAVSELPAASAVHIAYVLILGIFSSAIAYVLWAEAFLRAENTSSVSNYMFLTPFAAALLGFVFAAEVPDMGTVTGGVIIMAGVILFFKNNFVGKKRK